MNLQNLPINWFDLVVIAALVAGAIIGRKKGLSEELLPLLQWLAVVVIGGLYYRPVGRFVAEFASITLLTAYAGSYLGVIAFHVFLFKCLKRLVGERLVSSDLFGRFEYVLGMGAGALKFACLLLVCLALLNSRYVSPEDIAADSKLQKENFGTISFPTFGRIQNAIFRESISGPVIGRYLGDQLIASTPPGERLVYRESIGRKREKAVDEVLQNR